MTTDSIVTVVGTAVTLLGMAVTIWQASQARTYKKQIRLDIRKINLANVSERLGRAQDEVRRLPISAQSVPRGVRPLELIQKAKEHFDMALGTLDVNGPDANIRIMLAGAQSKMNAYEVSWSSGSPNPPGSSRLASRNAKRHLSIEFNDLQNGRQGMSNDDIFEEIEKIKYQIRVLGETINYESHPVESLILSMDWAEGDIDRAHDIFEKYDRMLESKQTVNWHQFEAELEKAFNIGYQTVKSIILAFYKNHQWTNVCYGYAMSFEPSTPIEFHQITRTKDQP